MSIYRLRNLICADPWAACVHWKDAPSAPPAPDYAAAASATAAGNVDAARLATKANRVNTYTPYGSQTFQQRDNDPDLWQSNITLDPRAQKTLDSQLALSQNLGKLGTDTVGRVDQQYGQPMDMNSVQATQDQAYKAQTSRLDPQWAANDEQQAARLSNQGITQGSEPYMNAMRTYGQSKNDAYMQARNAAINQAPQTYQLASAIREQPLNELNAIRTGAQIQNPQFQPYGNQQTTAGPDLLGAANAQNQYNMGLYNSGVGASNSFNSGLMQAAGTVGSMMMMSDRRLKRDVTRIGTHAIGVPLYAFRYLWSDEQQIGVMADEVLTVRPRAVAQHPTGFLMVDYGALNVQ